MVLMLMACQDIKILVLIYLRQDSPKPEPVYFAAIKIIK